MSSLRQNKFEGLCRLCTSVEHDNLHIFGDEGEVRQLASKIRICLPIFVHREDNLPKVVCLPCVSKLESFYNFREACVKAEGTLEAFLKEEQNFPHEPEICLEEGTSTKGTNAAHSECGEEQVGDSPSNGKEQKQQRGRRKKRNSTKLVVEGAKRMRRGKGCKAAEVPPTPVQGTEQSGSDAAALEGKVEVGRVAEQLGELPLPLSPASNLSQVLLPQLGDLHPEDYLLIKEEKFLAGANWNVESLFPPNNGGDCSFIKAEIMNNTVARDGECLDFCGSSIDGIKMEVESENTILKQTRQFLPPVWDVFEKVLGECKNDGAETAVVTHRRYIIGKRAFPCALCGNCFLLSGAGDVMEYGRSGGRGRSSSTDQGRDPSDRPYGCLRCSKRYFRRSDLVRHEKTHLADRPFLCRLCGKGFCRKEHAQRHMSLHVGEKPFQCEACLKPFTRKEHLARHQRCHHPEELIKLEGSFNYGRQEPNKDDEVTDASKDEMVHDDSQVRNAAVQSSQAKSQVEKAADAMKAMLRKPYECEICIRAFSRREHLVRHRRSHFREQMKAASLTLSASRRVIRIEEDPDLPVPTSLVDTVIEGLDDQEKVGYSCPYCTLAFNCKEQLDRHRSRMHPLAEAVSAMIPQSDESLTDLYSNAHTTLHAVPSPSPPHLILEKPQREPVSRGKEAVKESFSCVLCPQMFSRKENLERHLKSVHVGLKPYVCNCCGKRFGRAEQCRKHENRHQQNQVRGCAVLEEVSPRVPISLEDAGNSGTVESNTSTAPVMRKSSSKQSRGSSECEAGDNFRLENVAPAAGDSTNSKDGDTGKVKHSKSRGAKKTDTVGEVGHRSSKGTKRSKVHTCQVCGMEFSRKKHLVKHGSTHG